MSQIISIDLETTGFGRNDRVIEVAAVIFDEATGAVVGEIETLINPLRNVPEESTKVHGLRAADLSLAPTFDEVAKHLIKVFQGQKILAHNADFDMEFLSKEFERSGYRFLEGERLCTLRLTGQSLSVAAQQVSFEFSHHTAIEDAKASLAIWLSKTSNADIDGLFPENVNLNQNFRTLTRSQIGLSSPDLRRTGISNLLLELPVIGPEQTYLALIDAFLRDMQIDSLEGLSLRDFAEQNGISSIREVELQDIYLAEIENAALRDGIITEDEAAFYNKIAKSLGFDRVLEPSETPCDLPPAGSLICVTGTASVAGRNFDKKTMEAFLSNAGYVFTDAISKKSGVALLLQESAGSQSSKVAKAQAWGIPRMIIADFIDLVESA